MSDPIELPMCVIVVPPALAELVGQLTDRMAKTMGESASETRRGLELSVLTRGVQAVQAEIETIEAQARSMGWPT